MLGFTLKLIILNDSNNYLVLIVVLWSVVMLNVITLSVVAPLEDLPLLRPPQ
jgi:hypothetical protein